MTRFRGAVEQARRDLREMGASTRDARKQAPRLAEMRQARHDQRHRPYPWLGGRAVDDGESES